MKRNNQSDNIILDEYEQGIEDSIPVNFKPVYATNDEKEDFMKVAQQHKAYQTSKRINIRIKNEDLIRVKAKAKANNIPYQTLLGTLIHKYAKDDISISL